MNGVIPGERHSCGCHSYVRRSYVRRYYVRHSYVRRSYVRHSRESGNLLALQTSEKRHWIPAFAVTTPN